MRDHSNSLMLILFFSFVTEVTRSLKTTESQSQAKRKVGYQPGISCNIRFCSLCYLQIMCGPTLRNTNIHICIDRQIVNIFKAELRIFDSIYIQKVCLSGIRIDHLPLSFRLVPQLSYLVDDEIFWLSNVLHFV